MWNDNHIMVVVSLMVSMVEGVFNHREYRGNRLNGHLLKVGV